MVNGCQLNIPWAVYELQMTVRFCHFLKNSDVIHLYEFQFFILRLSSVHILISIKNVYLNMFNLPMV